MFRVDRRGTTHTQVTPREAVRPVLGLYFGHFESLLQSLLVNEIPRITFHPLELPSAGDEQPSGRK
jgi:hypothetical protein